MRALIDKLVVKYNDLVLELTLVLASQVVKGSDLLKLKYKLTKIQLEYRMIRSKTLETVVCSVYSTGKEFLYDRMIRSMWSPTQV